MKTLTVRLPESLVAEIEAESRGRGISKSDVVRDRLQGHSDSASGKQQTLAAIADLVGSVAGLSPDLSSRRKHYLRTTGYGRKRPR
jgi:Arc/MetJ-type ribon-helix-helix transcriptional regulator